MHSKYNSLKITKLVLIFSFSVLALFLGFFMNYWQTVNQQYFDNFQSDMESFVIGRIILSKQSNNILSSGGLTCVGLKKVDISQLNEINEINNSNYDPINNNFDNLWSIPNIFKNQYSAYTSGSFSFEKYDLYKSHNGGQGIFFSCLNKLITLHSQDKLSLFSALTSLLTAIALSAIILWFYMEFGLMTAIFVLASALLSQWLIVFGRNLWWSLWSFYLPITAILYYLRKKNIFTYKLKIFGAIIFFTVFFKCLITGYEFITTTLIMTMVPLVYYSILHRSTLRRFIFGGLIGVIASSLAILASFLILCFQIASVNNGSFMDGVDHITYSFKKRTHSKSSDFSSVYTPSLNASTVYVLRRYLDSTFFDANQYIHCSDPFVSKFILKIKYKYLLLLFIIMSVFLYFLKNRYPDKKEKQKCIALIIATWFSILAPLSWFIIFNSHSYIHVNMDEIVWQMPFIFFGFAVCGYCLHNVYYYNSQASSNRACDKRT